MASRTAPLRSRKGCWTCRLRKKKCDEIHPHCRMCTSLSITCYGYGAKPEWMDGGEKEKGVKEEIAEIVKYSWRRRGTMQVERNVLVERGSRIEPRDGSENTGFADGDEVVVGEGSGDSSVTAVSENGSLGRSPGTVVQDSSSATTPFSNSHHQASRSNPSLSAENSILLMHYLDQLFPIQYPLYKPHDRGWLLTFLLFSKPLLHPTLALSAYHRQLFTTHHSCLLHSKVQRDEHLVMGLKEINEYANQGCASQDVGLLGGVLQLVFYELYTGTQSWKLHLNAACHIYIQAQEQPCSPFNLTPSTPAPTPSSQKNAYEELLTTQATNFQTTLLLYLDVLSSITFGTSPRLLTYHPQLLSSPNSSIYTKDLFGPTNHILLQISRTSLLWEQKCQALELACDGALHLDCTSKAHIVGEISLELQNARAKCSFVSLIGEEKEERERKLVQLMWVYMGIVYLHLVLRDFDDLGVLDGTVGEVMGVLRGHVPRYLYGALVAPIFLIAVVVGEEGEAFFREVFGAKEMLVLGMGQRGRMLPVLGEVWRRRKEERACFGWTAVLKLIEREGVLLI